MKKYIAPAFQVVNLNSEDTLLAGSFGLNKAVGGTELSNKADDADWEDED